MAAAINARAERLCGGDTAPTSRRMDRRRRDSPHGIARGPSAGVHPTQPRGQPDEKEQMRGLNDRLAGFVEKVRHLERQNHLLEREIREIRGKASPASRLEEEYGRELSKLRELVQDIARQKRQIEVEHRNLEDELSDLRTRHEQEARSRSDAERSVVVLKKDVNDAYRAKLQLDKKAEALVDEIQFLKNSHEAEMSEMHHQIQGAQVTAPARGFGNAGVTAALRDIRAQLEGHAVSDVQQVGETFRSQFAKLTKDAETKREALKATQQEIQEYRRRLQAKNIELDCAKGTREALERQLHDIEDHHKEEMIHYQNTIKELENELINCKFDMSGYLREYQDLLNVKMALDVEILSYRKLLCGEEARLSSMSDTHISLPYIYHQSPVYTLPCFSRPGDPHRRAEPQYKFVEEIITETTREIEMSEFEESGSEETEVGQDEQECTKRGGSEEEVDDKDSREDEGEQMSDGEQNQVASAGSGVSDGSPGEADGGERRQSGEEASEETEAGGDNVDSGGEEDSQRKVLPSDSLDEKGNEQHQKAAENAKEKEAAAAAVQRDVSSKPGGMKSGAPEEDEGLEKRDGGKNEDAEKDISVSAQAGKPVDEIVSRGSKGSDKTQELGSFSEVQGGVRTLASEPAEKTADLTAETKSALSGETDEPSEKAPESSSTAAKSEEKENSPTEPKETSKSEPPKSVDKVAESTQDAKHDSTKARDKEAPLKSNVTSLPGAEDQKPTSGEGTQTARAALPKEKAPAKAEIKEVHQGAPESSEIQKPEPSQASEKTINDPPGKSEKVESSKSEK